MSKGHNSVKISSIVTKIKYHPDIIIINLYDKFHFKMCNLYEENDRKLQISGIFKVRET